MNLDVSFEELLPDPVEGVWSQLTDAAAISEWLMATSDFRPQPGGRFKLKTQHLAVEGWVRAEVLELDPPRRMVWSWWADEAAPPTTVTFQLSEDAGGTRLKLTHAGRSRTTRSTTTEPRARDTRSARASVSSSRTAATCFTRTRRMHGASTC